MGTSSFGIVAGLVSLTLSGCAFDSLADSAGGASLGGDDTSGTGADEGGSRSTSDGSASTSGSGTTTPEATAGGSESDPTSASNTNPTSESESASNTNANTESASESESATSQGTDATGEPTTGNPTTGGVLQPYSACPEGNECPATDTCIPVWNAGATMVVGSWCAELDCVTDDDCPDPPMGNATPRCRGPNTEGDMLCVLDCASDMLTCPDGMECWSLTVGWRCVWPV